MNESRTSFNNEKKNNQFESNDYSGTVISELRTKIKSIDEDKLNPEQRKTFQKIKDIIFRTTKKFVRTVELVTAITSVLAVANYNRTHSELEFTKDKSIDISNSKEGNIYKHKDERTTHLLNILAGVEKFNEDDIRNETNGFVKEFFEVNGIKTDKDINLMSIDEINTIFNEVSKSDTSFHTDDYKKFFYDQLKEINDTNVRYSDVIINKDIYELVWQMEQECGNPKIRFISENIRFTPFSEYAGNQHYDPINNIVYVSAWNLAPDAYGETFFAEMAHSKQFNDNQIGSTINVLSDFVGIAIRGKFSSEKLAAEYSKLYGKPGSIEHQAHGIIEPYLNEKYKLSIKKFNDKNEQNNKR